MSWLYTILFSSLVFSGGSGSAPTHDRPADGNNPAAIVRSDETERFDQTYPLSANGKVSVSNVNGSITLEAWDRNEISLGVVKTADSKDSLDSVKLVIDSKADSFSISTDYGNWRNNGRNWTNNRRVEIQITLKVPSSAILDEIETVNGTVKLSGFTNVSKISAVNGNVQATNLRGSSSLSTVNGEVVADFGTLDEKSKLVLSTVNGRVSISIPSNSNATIKADSLNGNISNDFGLPVRKGRYVGRDLYGRIGTGSASIKLSSVNGELKINHPNDGTTPNPVVNLLQQKSNDNDDWDDDDAVDDSSRSERERVRAVARANADIAREAKESARVGAAAAELAARQAKQELVEMQPLIAKINAEAAAQVSGGLSDLRATIPELAAAQRELALADERFFRNEPRFERKSNTFTVQGTPTISVNANGCSVYIHGSESQVVKYSLTQLSGRRDRGKLNVVEKATPSSVELSVEGAQEADGNFARLEITVPRRSNLKVITDREIRIDSVSGTVDLTGENESVNLRDIDGKLSARTAEGEIRLIGFSGDAEAHSECGLVSLEGAFSRLKVDSLESRVVITLDPSTSANVETNSEAVRFEGFQNVKESGSEESRRFKLGNGGTGYSIRSSSEVLFRTPDTIVSGI